MAPVLRFIIYLQDTGCRIFIGYRICELQSYFCDENGLWNFKYTNCVVGIWLIFFNVRTYLSSIVLWWLMWEVVSTGTFFCLCRVLLPQAMRKILKCYRYPYYLFHWNLFNMLYYVVPAILFLFNQTVLSNRWSIN